jgi:hypothetical protein
MTKKPDDQYSPEEAKERMKAALLGARLAGHVPMKEKPKVKVATRHFASHCMWSSSPMECASRLMHPGQQIAFLDSARCHVAHACLFAPEDKSPWTCPQ